MFLLRDLVVFITLSEIRSLLLLVLHCFIVILGIFVCL